MRLLAQLETSFPSTGKHPSLLSYNIATRRGCLYEWTYSSSLLPNISRDGTFFKENIRIIVFAMG